MTDSKPMTTGAKVIGAVLLVLIGVPVLLLWIAGCIHLFEWLT